MAFPLMLGGVEIVLHAGAPEFSEDTIGGDSLDRMSDGTAVKQTHWEKAAGTISGQGFMPPGLDGLNYKLPLELRSTQVSSMQQTVLEFELTSTPRPDHDPWAYALVGGKWYRAEVSTIERAATVTAVNGARFYQVWWFPVYSVFARKPSKTQGQTGAGHGWSISWEEA